MRVKDLPLMDKELDKKLSKLKNPIEIFKTINDWSITHQYHEVIR